jgi:hypothetical protein
MLDIPVVTWVIRVSKKYMKRWKCVWDGRILYKITSMGEKIQYTTYNVVGTRAESKH